MQHRGRRWLPPVSAAGLLATDVLLAPHLRGRQAGVLQRLEGGVDHVRVATQVGDVGGRVRGEFGQMLLHRMAHCASTSSLARVLVSVHVLNVRCPYWRCAASRAAWESASAARLHRSQRDGRKLKCSIASWIEGSQNADMKVHDLFRPQSRYMRLISAEA